MAETPTLDQTKGHKTFLYYGDVGASASNKIARITELTPPSIEADDIEVTNMDSPDDFKEYLAGLGDGGEIELTSQFKKTQASTVYGLFRQNKSYAVKFPDGSRWNVTGYIKTYGDEVDREGVITTTLTIKVSGKPEFVEGGTTS